MPFDAVLAERIRKALLSYPASLQSDLTEKKMFGGLAFLLRGKMTIGIIGEELAVRVVEEKMEEMLKMNHVRPMDFTKKPMKEFIYVSQEGLQSEKELHRYIALGIEHARVKLKS
ncbi:TfoX/Sxy family protein [Muriicola soli]|uniref:TfoX family protein n=1 Tax=Muriicola soli TaxID=2507538 RepID=A0A411E836_9FLAO|nr:TfoX/Sxy family protein [Muriicola soli]QBA63849.1 TfoX family protein [Muriicola soli]